MFNNDKPRPLTFREWKPECYNIQLYCFLMLQLVQYCWCILRSLLTYPGTQKLNTMLHLHWLGLCNVSKMIDVVRVWGKDSIDTICQEKHVLHWVDSRKLWSQQLVKPLWMKVVHSSRKPTGNRIALTANETWLDLRYSETTNIVNA